jgi:hypothetical protein
MKGQELVRFLRRNRRIQQVKDAGLEAVDFLDNLMRPYIPGRMGQPSRDFGLGTTKEIAGLRTLITGGGRAGKEVVDEELRLAEMREGFADRRWQRERAMGDQLRRERARRGSSESTR